MLDSKQTGATTRTYQIDDSLFVPRAAMRGLLHRFRRDPYAAGERQWWWQCICICVGIRVALPVPSYNTSVTRMDKLSAQTLLRSRRQQRATYHPNIDRTPPDLVTRVVPTLVERHRLNNSLRRQLLHVPLILVLALEHARVVSGLPYTPHFGNGGNLFGGRDCDQTR